MYTSAGQLLMQVDTRYVKMADFYILWQMSLSTVGIRMLDAVTTYRAMSMYEP